MHAGLQVKNGNGYSIAEPRISQIDDGVGVVAVGRGQVGRVDIGVIATLQAAMLQVGQVDGKGRPGDEIAEVVERAPDLVIPVNDAPVEIFFWRISWEYLTPIVLAAGG